MCFDRLADEETLEASLPALLAAEWHCAVRNGAMAAGMVLVVLLVQGAPVWVVGVSVAGAVALGTALHQAVLLAGAGLLRARARWRESRRGSAT